MNRWWARASQAKHARRRIVSPRRALAVAGALAVLGATLITLSAESGTGALNMSTPLVPVNVTAVQDGVAPDITVTWHQSPTGPTETGALVQIYQALNLQLQGGAKYLGNLVCQNSCTSLTFRQLTFDSFYVFLIFPTNSSGTGAPAASPVVATTTTCQVGACVNFDTSNPIGPANHADSGILNSVFNVGNEPADLAALDTTMYRGNPTYNPDGSLNWTPWNIAVAAGAQTTFSLSNLWSDYYGGNPATPWSNWTAYQTWVTNTVTAALKAGEQVNYWEVYNEPGGNDNYYSAANYATETSALLLQQFFVAYTAIKAADPSAQVMGPSLAQWEDYPGEYGSGPEFDMVTFLNFCVQNDIVLGAISWHEIIDNYGPNPDENTLLPQNIEDHVAEARALLAARPSLGNPIIAINEFSMPEVQLIPGWDVNYLAALTDAQVNTAGLSCFGNECANADMDGLLGTDGTTQWNEYWARAIYASMSGSMVTTSSTSDYVGALGSYNSTTGVFTGLIGRGEGCTTSQEAYCTQTWPTDQLAPPISVNVTVHVPWSSGTVNVALTDVPGQNVGPTPQPAPVDSAATIAAGSGGGGYVTINIPSFADGDAYGLTLSLQASQQQVRKR